MTATSTTSRSSLLFFARLREQEAYDTLDELKAAIAADVEASLEIAGFPAADVEWVAVLGPIDITDPLGAGSKAFMYAAPLDAAGIPYRWDPFAPEDRPTSIPGGNTFEPPFTLLVPARVRRGRRRRARAGAARRGCAPWRSRARTPSYADDSYIEDPEALEAAEQAVRRVDIAPRRLPEPPPAGWVQVAADMPYDRPRLSGVEYALAAAGIPTDWDPFAPTEAPLLKLFGLRHTTFRLRVPLEHAEAARLLIAEVDAR